MATVTRTTNPLPLHDLEPHRFEDLVRQLAYDFRDWQKLEATGRAGSDDGFDARGLERMPAGESAVALEESTDSIDEMEPATRLWLIQCKREKAIGPKKIRTYVEGLPPEEPIHGVLFAAACDFSKATRDAFEAACRDKGYAEIYLWGKAEIEDSLFQPKNDHLLFAYFGISLRLRKRSLQTSLRAMAATKKTLRRVFQSSHAIVFRGVESEYPKLPGDEKPTWIVVWNSDIELAHDGLRINFRAYQAYVSNDGDKWDAANAFGLQRSTFHDGRWGEPDRHPQASEVDTFWYGLDEKNKSWMHINGRMPYERVLAIDEVGDELFSGPIIYVDSQDRWLFDGTYAYIQPNSSFAEAVPCEAHTRIEVFPASTRRV